MRQHVNINEIENPLFYLNENNPDKYRILGAIDCFAFDILFESIYKVNVNNGNVSILEEIYSIQPRELHFKSLTYYGNGLIYFKKENECYDFYKDVIRQKIKKCQNDELKYNNLLTRIDVR